MTTLLAQRPRGTQWPDLMAEAAMTDHVAGLCAEVRYILGRRDTGFVSTSVFGDVAQYLTTGQSDINVPTTGQTLYVVSSSTADAAGGVGARSVEVIYLDANGIEGRITKTLTGTTPVSLGTGFSTIQWMEVATNSSRGAVATGNLSVTSATASSAVAVDNTFERINAGGNRSMSGRYKIPADHTGFLHSWSVSAPSSSSGDFRVRADVSAYDRSLTEGVFHFQATSVLSSGSDSGEKQMDYLKMPPLSTVKCSVIPGSAASGPRFEFNADLLLVKTT
jgi:hypothetical protein